MFVCGPRVQRRSFSYLFASNNLAYFTALKKNNCSLQVFFRVVFINHLFKDVILDLK